MSALRPVTEVDVSAAASLMNEHWPEPVGTADLLNDWTSPRVDLVSDVRIGDEVYVLVEDIGDRRAWIEAHGRNVVSGLDWAEGRSRDKGASRGLSRAGLGVDAEDGAHLLYESVGMRVTRQFEIYEKAVS